jgi:hypothetical protein
VVLWMVVSYDNDRNQALGMLRAGISTREVARLFNCHQSTVVRLRQRFQTTSVVTLGCPGRERSDTLFVVWNLCLRRTTVLWWQLNSRATSLVDNVLLKKIQVNFLMCLITWNRYLLNFKNSISCTCKSWKGDMNFLNTLFERNFSKKNIF